MTAKCNGGAGCEEEMNEDKNLELNYEEEMNEEMNEDRNLELICEEYHEDGTLWKRVFRRCYSYVTKEYRLDGTLLSVVDEHGEGKWYYPDGIKLQKKVKKFYDDFFETSYYENGQVEKEVEADHSWKMYRENDGTLWKCGDCCGTMKEYDLDGNLVRVVVVDRGKEVECTAFKAV